MEFKPHYTPDLIRDELFIDDVRVKTKFGAAHGGRGSSASMARFAAAAQMRGEVDTLIFTGGARVFDPLTLAGITKFNPSYFLENGLATAFHLAGQFLSPRREALQMADIAMKEGVPSAKVIIEGDGRPRSKHTGTNVDFLLDHSRDLEDALLNEGALTVFGLVYNTRRLCGTWQRKVNEDRQACDFTIAPRSFYPYGFTAENWPQSADIRERIVYAEMAKIDPANPQSLLHTTDDVSPFQEFQHRKRAIAQFPSFDRA